MEIDLQIGRKDRRLPEERGVGGMHKKGKMIKNYKLAITEESRGCEVQHKEYSQ